MHIGIIGFGVVGKSACKFLRTPLGQVWGKNSTKISVYDNREYSSQDRDLLLSLNIEGIWGDKKILSSFIESCELLIASPGVDLSEFSRYAHKILSELSIFSQFWQKKTLAITGSLGKTTVTKLLGALVSSATKERVIVGGNIGTGMLDLLQDRDLYDRAVLELSSFQLSYFSHFAPDVAIILNCYKNHLDRHKTFENYYDSKLNIIRAQREGQWTLLGSSLFMGKLGDLTRQALACSNSHLCIIWEEILSPDKLKEIIISLGLPREKFSLFFVYNKTLFHASISDRKVLSCDSLVFLANLPDVTFEINWVFVLSTLFVLGGDIKSIFNKLITKEIPLDFDRHHRVELIAQINSVDFYNDSKSTVIQATQAAVTQLSQYNRPLIIILGGLGKGVDRSSLTSFLLSNKLVKKFYCFGPECEVFGPECKILNTLEDILLDIKKIMSTGDIVLFSPSGTSFDFFKNYEHRGDIFCNLVCTLI
jgi:UDP-N-acetylmuramoylalanine--D-glutamate ligase